MFIMSLMQMIKMKILLNAGIKALLKNQNRITKIILIAAISNLQAIFKIMGLVKVI